MKFDFPEEVCTIKRVRNEVFIEDDRTLCVLRPKFFRSIVMFMEDRIKAEGFVVRRDTFKCDILGAYNKVKLGGPYHFECNSSTDTITLVKGYERIYVVDELGRPVSHDYDIDIMADIQRLKELKEGKLC